MNKFKLTIDGSGVRQLTTQVLEEAVFGLRDNVDSFILLEPKNPIENSIYLQAISQEDFYIAEIRFVFGSADNFKHYSKTIKSKEELFELFKKYLNEEIPNVIDWTDETSSLLDLADDEDEMIKLYKQDIDGMHYFEIWLNDDGVSLTTHTGIVGDTGVTEDIFYDEKGDLPVKVGMKQLVATQKELGYNTMSLIEVVVQYCYDKADEGSFEVEKQKNVLESILNESLGWTGNGHCDGGDAHNQIANLFCYVIDKKQALVTILESFEEVGIPLGLKIAYADDITEEYQLLYPNEGYFSIV